MATGAVNASPQIGVRFKPEEMQRLRDRAAEDFGGNVSVLVKVAVKRLLDSDESPAESNESDSPAEAQVA